ncbi:Ig-like domain-containing protein [Pediococcus ethanolidurans]|uniref:Ig-like domain-containing protein n=1 Tax=Pediococcus ethanolidurans TaxID=319653 RepID=UPI0021AA70E0|nr:Ig-like domain-containing protein [Pediococcus ethanolidurans]MCT4397742.1 Ig-like domain-containing protein [Pediococcus ethanolidurans]
MKKILIYLSSLLVLFGLIYTYQGQVQASTTDTASSAASSDSTSRAASSSATSSADKQSSAAEMPQLNLTGSSTVIIGGNDQLKGTVTNVKNAKPVWSSSQTNVATVTQSGLVRGKKAGETIITLAYQGQTKQIVITVPKPKLSITGSSTVNVDATKQLKGRITNVKNPRFTWKSSRTSVATVSQQGLVKGEKAGTVTITLIGNFKMNGNVKLPTKANVHINATKANFTGKAGFFYGVLISGLNWEGGTFYGGGHESRLLRDSKTTFRGATFHQACGIGGHIFDLMGCSNVTITNSHFYGYGHTLSTATMRKNGNHGEYGESIQTDYANYNSGGPGFNKYGKGHFNGAPSTYITVTHNTWAPEYSGRKLISLAQVAIGQHDTISSNRRMIAHINFSYNTIKNAVRLSGMGADIKYFGAPVHFESSKSLTINHNTFSTTLKQARPENDIIISNQYGHMPHTTAVSIQNNSFTGYHASYSAIQLYARRGHSIKGVTVKRNNTHGMRLIRRYGSTSVRY